jgi:hypothetical protein
MKLTLIFSLLLISFSSFAGYHCGHLKETIDVNNAPSGAPFVVAKHVNTQGVQTSLEGKLTETLNEYFYTSHKFELMDTKGEKAVLNVKITQMSGGRGGCSPRACNKMNAERISAILTYQGVDRVLFCQKTAN